MDNYRLPGEAIAQHPRFVELPSAAEATQAITLRLPSAEPPSYLAQQREAYIRALLAQMAEQSVFAGAVQQTVSDFEAQSGVSIQQLRNAAAAVRRNPPRDEVVRAMDTPEQRAASLWYDCLTPEQRVEWDSQRPVTVQGNHTGRRYYIYYGKQQNICLLSKKGKATNTYYCAMPKQKDLPVYDVMVAQKLMIENDEQGFLKVANVFKQTDHGLQEIEQRRQPSPLPLPF